MKDGQILQEIKKSQAGFVISRNRLIDSYMNRYSENPLNNYHTSWDSLISVVEKINSDEKVKEFALKPSSGKSRIWLKGSFMANDSNEELDFITDVWFLVIKFIIWHNELKFEKINNFERMDNFERITINVVSFTNLLSKDLTLVGSCYFIETNLFPSASTVSRQKGSRVDWFVEGKLTTGHQIDLLEKAFQNKIKSLI
jgi:hypothetical protein